MKTKHYLDNSDEKLYISAVIERLEYLMRYDCFIDSEHEIQEYFSPLSGEYVKWDDLKELIESIKKRLK